MTPFNHPMDRPLEVRGLQPGSLIAAKGHLWSVSGQQVITPEKFDLSMNKALSVVASPDDRTLAIGTSGRSTLPPLIHAEGIWTGQAFDIQKLRPGVETPDFWWSGTPTFSGEVPADAVRWSLAEQIDARSRLDDSDIVKLLSLRFLPTPDGRTVVVALTDHAEWARSRLAPIFSASLIIRPQPWSKMEFEAASNHVGATIDNYNVVLTGIRSVANGALEIYIFVSFLVDSLQAWVARLPVGMATVQNWISRI